MTVKNLFLIRVIIGLTLFIIGIASLFIIFAPHGLRITFENRISFILTMFAVSTTIGFGAYLFSGYPLKKFLEPFLVFTLWIFLIFLPTWLAPIPTDAIILIQSFSLFLLVLLYGNYTKWREKRKKRELKGKKFDFH